MARAPSGYNKSEQGFIDRMGDGAWAAIKSVADNISAIIAAVSAAEDVTQNAADALDARDAAINARNTATTKAADSLANATAAGVSAAASETARAASVVAKDASVAAKVAAEAAVAAASFSSGTYVPVITDRVGIGVITITKAIYCRVGNVVDVCFQGVHGDVTNGIQASFSCSLPVASDFTETHDCAGVSVNQMGNGIMITANTNPAKNVAEFSFTPTITGGAWFTARFQYLVK